MKDQYLLQDGTYADPKDCSAGKDGVLRNKNGLVVSMDANGEPMTLQTIAEGNKNLEAAGKTEAPPAESAAAKPVKAE